MSHLNTRRTLFKATELQNNVRIYDYMLYSKWRWRNRVTRVLDRFDVVVVVVVIIVLVPVLLVVLVLLVPLDKKDKYIWKGLV